MHKILNVLETVKLQETKQKQEKSSLNRVNPFNPVLLIIPFLLLKNLKIRIINQDELNLLIHCRLSVIMCYWFYLPSKTEFLKGNRTQSAVCRICDINSIQRMALEVLYFTGWCLLFPGSMVKLSSLSYF